MLMGVIGTEETLEGIALYGIVAGYGSHIGELVA
jgi:hypothetical protein